MASIYKKKNGRWIVDYLIAGTRRRPVFSNKAEAEAFKRSLMLRPIDQITDFREVKEITLSEAVDQYLQQVTPAKAPRTWEVDRRSLGVLVNELGSKLINEVTLLDLESFQANQRKIVSASSVNRYFNVIKHFFKKCEDWGYIKDMPTRRLENLKAAANPRKLWTREQIQEFFRLAPDWLKEIVYFIYQTGVRRGEAVSLKWKDVDFSQNAIRIGSIKGGIPRIRLIPMTTSMREWFLELKNRNPFLTKSDMQVFLGEHGEMINANYVSTNVYRVVKKMECEFLGMHGLRHTILTELVQSDVSLEKVRQLAGHSNLKTTEQYLHLKIEDTRSVLENLGEKRNFVRPIISKKAK